MELNQIGECIESQESEIISRKFSKGYLKQHPLSGKKMFYYKCTRNSTAEIIKELKPKEPRINKASNLDKGDYLNAQDFDLWVDRKKRFNKKDFELVHPSSSHKSTKVISKEFTFAKITKRLDSIPERHKELKK